MPNTLTLEQIGDILSNDSDGSITESQIERFLASSIISGLIVSRVEDTIIFSTDFTDVDLRRSYKAFLDSKRVDFTSALPDDVLQEIFSYLEDIDDTRAFELVNRKLNKVSLFTPASIPLYFKLPFRMQYRLSATSTFRSQFLKVVFEGPQHIVLKLDDAGKALTRSLSISTPSSSRGHSHQR